MIAATSPEEQFSAGAIFKCTMALLNRNAGPAAAALALSSALSVALDSGMLTGQSLNLLLTLASVVLGLFLQFWVTQNVLEELGLYLGRSGQLLLVLGLNMLSYLAIFIGWILLIIPGIILAVRWSVSLPILLTSNEGIVGSLQRSWELTTGRFWPILAAFLILFLAMLAAFMALAMGMLLFAVGPIGEAVITSVAINGSMIVNWHAAVAIYALMRPSSHVSEVFA